MNTKNTASPQQARSGETTIPRRTGRFFEQENYWYFRTREGMDIGPFDTLDEAKVGLTGFIGFLQQAQQDVVTRITQYIKLQPRAGENIGIPTRSSRVFEQNDYWYYRTREGMDIGPFDSRGAATLGVKSFVEFLEDSQPEVVERVTSYIRLA